MTSPLGADGADLTADGFLGGRLTLLQPRSGHYRAGVDPVLLAAACPAREGQSVLDLGCGVGAASLCLLARVPGTQGVGVEFQPELAELARRNAQANGLPLEVLTADVGALPRALRQRRFDHVIANPPYFDRSAGSRSPHPGRDSAHGEGLPLANWIDTGLRRLAPRGWLTLIHRIEALPRLLQLLEGRIGAISALPVAARSGRPAERVVLRARQGAKSPFRLLAPLVMHRGRAHGTDSADYSATARRILREGAALPPPPP